MASAVRIADGTLDFSGGVDSGRIATVQSESNPNGLPRTMLAWLDNATVRGGTISPRAGWLKLLALVQTGLFQGGFLYAPLAGDPYFIVSVSGTLYQVLVDAPQTVTNLSTKFNLHNPAGVPQAYFAQGQQFLVIQAGDMVTLPLFWDGQILRRSNGLPVPVTTTISYALTTTLAWVVPPVGGTVVVTLSSPYPGNPNDIIQWGGYGTFQVTAISGNTITLTTLTTSLAGASVLPGPYNVGANPGAATVTYTVTTTNTPTIFGNIGATFNAVLSAPYTGNLGDTIVWVSVGTFTVIGLSNTNHTVSLSVVSLVTVPGVLGAGTYTWVATPPPTPPAATTLYTVTTTNSPTVNRQTGFTFNSIITVAYGGAVGDVVNFIGLGVFTVIGLSPDKKTVTFSEVTMWPGSGVLAANTFTWIAMTTGQASSVTVITPELPAAGPMVYYQGRIWYAQVNQYTAGDIVFGPSGTLPYNFEDSILKVTENPLAIGGDGFSVPVTDGPITALAFTANLNTNLGQGPLYIFTTKSVYSLVVPVSRTDWINANAANQPNQTLAQIDYGSTSDRCVVHVNGDLFYQTLLPAITSLTVAQRFYNTWANRPLSRNVQRVFHNQNTTLMGTATGINFDNRLLMGVLPYPTPVGVAFQAIAVLDFDIISTFGSEGISPFGTQQPVPPAWEGIYEGMDFLQLFTGNFGGTQRAFAFVHSKTTGGIDLWEITTNSLTDQGDTRVNWLFETPAFTFQRDFDLKELDGSELWVDNISGDVLMKFEYRVDADPCWQLWTQVEFCAARNACEDATGPVCSNYPQATFCKGQKFPLTLPKPKPNVCESMNKRPTNIGYQFQMRVTVKGSCRVRGLLEFALPRERAPFEGINC